MNQANRMWDSRNYAFLALLAVGLLLLYFPFLKKLVIDWGHDDDYSHGYFIPLLSAYFVYSIRGELRELEIRPNTWGLLLAICGFAQLLVAKIGGEYFLQRTSLIPVLLGTILFLLGWEYLKKLAFPVLYLLFMIPLPAIIWNRIAFPLQLFASAATEKVIYAMGIPILREGNVLHLAETSLEVVAACSGLRSLMTMFALGGALAFLSRYATWKKVVLFLSAAPIAIIANIMRLTLTAYLASEYGPEVAHGFMHDFSGLVVFILGMSMLFGVHAILSKTRGG